jgi:HK97 family phage major capsid protein
MTLEELRAQLAEDKDRVREIDSQHAGEYLDPESDDGKDWAERNQRIADTAKTIDQIERRQQRVAELFEAGEGESGDGPAPTREQAQFHTRRPGFAGNEDIFDLSIVRASMADPRQQGAELRDRAVRAIERSRPKHPDFDPDDGKANAERLLDVDAEDGRFARYLLSVGSPVYKRAFGKYIAGDQRNREEQAALEAAKYAERALSLTGAAGGFAVPFELDPTVLNTSNGVINPIRQISRVEQITTDEWRGITSTGITASYNAEATETTDNAPTLVQPTVSTEKAQAFVPFSIEIGQDWTGLQASMAALLQEAKDILEAAKFVSGTGTNEPFGVLTGTTTTVAAATGLTMTLANLYALRASLPPRYRSRGTFIGNLLILDRIRQFDTVGSSAAIWVDSLQSDAPGMLLGRPVYEASEISGTIVNAQKFMVYGDFSRYLIVDRVGLNVELIPHLFGANRRPTGERGLYAYWRNGAKVIDANAFRALVGTT